jgi:IS5 family transposase
VFRTVCDRPTLWEALLPLEALVMPAELVAVDELLDDPRFFEPFRPFFDPTWGRPSVPMETYLRLMFLKYRYRLGYETLCAEVGDSLTWLRFCRIPLGEAAPHPSTLAKITTRCGTAAIEGPNRELVAVAAETGALDLEWLRLDTTVVPADIRYPTDSGLLTRAITKMAVLVGRLQAAGYAPRTGFDDRTADARTADARTAAHRIGVRLRRRSDDAKAEVLVITGELADLADTCCDQAKRVLTNARRGPDRALKRRLAILADLAHVIDATGEIIDQTRIRLAGGVPAGATRRVSLCDDDARPIRKGSLANPVQFGYTGQVCDNRQGIVLDYEVEAGMPPDAGRIAPAAARIIAAVGHTPAAVTADRGYGQASVDRDLGALGVDTVAILRKGRPGAARQAEQNEPDFVELVKWRTGAEGRIAALKRQHGWARTRLRGLDRARTWCGWGIWSHNAIKIAALTH